MYLFGCDSLLCTYLIFYFQCLYNYFVGCSAKQLHCLGVFLFEVF